MKAKSDERTGMMSLSARDLSRMIRNKELSVVDVVLSSLEEIEKKDKDINAFITVCEREDLIKRAEQVQKQIDNGELKNSPLAGVPIAIKDNICTRGIRTTCGSAILKNFVPPYSATAVERLEKAGLIIMGKTNMDEFGMGNTTSNSCFGATLNPVSFAKLDSSTGVERSFFRDNPNSNEHMINGYTAGGSSGGSAAAVAAGMVPIALGTDTGGSIRQPSSHCGVYGIKSTYGTVSRYGLIAYASSMDQIGPIASHPEDLAAVLKIISGSDIRDETCTDSPDLIKASISNKDRIKIAVISDGQSPKLSLHPAVINALKEAESKLESKGASLSDISIPELEFALYAYYIIACAEASSNLSRYDGVKYGYRTPEYEDLDEMVKKTRSKGFGEEVKR
ncbi:MAG: aspartyl/glutamyl-tRNA amidotransferase subunit A, partial [Eubacterium sp.]|nr:aspartyl/glutamyl-tRNA amidotransferase subunit A [Eubacterium sp.]